MLLVQLLEPKCVLFILQVLTPEDDPAGERD